MLEELCQRISNIVTETDIPATGPSSTKLTKFQKMIEIKNTQNKHLNELLNCIKIHQEIQQFMTQTGEVFSTMIFIQGMCCSINMCTTSYHFSLVSFTLIISQNLH